jgi:hypothetical protein
MLDILLKGLITAEPAGTANLNKARGEYVAAAGPKKPPESLELIRSATPDQLPVAWQIVRLEANPKTKVCTLGSMFSPTGHGIILRNYSFTTEDKDGLPMTRSGTFFQCTQSFFSITVGTKDALTEYLRKGPRLFAHVLFCPEHKCSRMKVRRFGYVHCGQRGCERAMAWADWLVPLSKKSSCYVLSMAEMLALGRLSSGAEYYWQHFLSQLHGGSSAEELQAALESVVPRAVKWDDDTPIDLQEQLLETLERAESANKVVDFEDVLAATTSEPTPPPPPPASKTTSSKTTTTTAASAAEPDPAEPTAAAKATAAKRAARQREYRKRKRETEMAALLAKVKKLEAAAKPGAGTDDDTDGGADSPVEIGDDD